MISEFVVGMYIAWTLPFFILMALIVIASIADINNENFAWMAAVIVAVVAVNLFTGNTTLLWNVVVELPVYLAIYVVGGLLWSFVRFYILVNKSGNIYSEARSSGLTIEQAANRVSNVMGQYGSYPIKARNCKMFIMTTLVYWPLSILWFFLSDACAAFGNWVMNNFSLLYQQIADSGSSQYLKDLADEEARKKAADSKLQSRE